ncbi:MAG: hypothetical protein WAL22_00375, partial [Solirubrobacteraceae bacterium]
LTLILMLVGCLATVGLVSGCGSSSSNSSTAAQSSSSTTHFAKTKFLLHAGLAFGAFHRYIYKPFKAGDFKHPFLHKLTLVKAAVAALFVEHELRLAATDVKSSKILSKLFSPLTAVADKISSLKDSIKDGSISSSDMDGVQSQLTSISKTASSKGQSIQNAIPSAGQLASGLG